MHGRIEWTSKSSRELRQEGMCRVCHATVYRRRGADNTQWTDETAHSSGLPFLPRGGRWDRVGNGRILTVTRQVPPGVVINARSHPHALKFCHWLDGHFVGVASVVEMMGAITTVMALLEEKMHLSKENRHAYHLSMRHDCKLPAFDADLMPLRQRLNEYGFGWTTTP